MTDTLDRRRSVTRADFNDASPRELGNGVWLWQILDSALPTQFAGLPGRGAYTWPADAVLRATPDLEDLWAGAVNQAVTKIACRGWRIADADDSARRTRRGQDLVMNLDGAAAYRSGISKLCQDFLLTRNGCFLEVEREGKNPASRPRALWHLDSLRCRRTGSVAYPVVYLGLDNSWHALRASDVIFFADMPDPGARLYGIGRPAAERAYKTVIKLAAVETYFREKITGARALSLVFISGVTKRKLQDVKETSDHEMERRGWTVYKGAVMVPTETDQPVSIATVDLAGVPDGFDVEGERRAARLTYANALGVPVQDIEPLSGQGLGTGTQSIVLDEAAEGRGLAFFSQALEDQINWLLMPQTTTFEIQTNDLRDRRQEADLRKVQTDTLVALLGTATAPGLLTQQQALNMAADWNLVPKEFVPVDQTPAGSVTDSGEGSKPAEAAAPIAALPEAAPPAPLALAAKADDGEDDEWQAALRWARQAQDGA